MSWDTSVDGGESHGVSSYIWALLEVESKFFVSARDNLWTIYSLGIDDG